MEQKCGRPPTNAKMTRRKTSLLVRTALLKLGVSTRKLARKYGISQTRVCQILRKEQVHHLQRERSANYHGDQAERAKKCCQVLRRHFFAPSLGYKIVMDDESYFPLKSDNCPGNSGYYKRRDMAKGDVPEEIRFCGQDKYPVKLMVWVAISEHGISEPFFCPRKVSVNGEIYRSDCIEERLVPFLNKFHADGMYYFWPDLASSHYAKATLDLFERENIAYIPKTANPPNCPQLRPIEDFWGCLKSAVYNDGWEARSLRQLRQRIRQKLRGFNQEFCQTLFHSVRKNIRNAAEKGVLSANH